MTMYEFPKYQEKEKRFEISVGTHKRTVPFTAYVAFTTKAEARQYSQMQLILGIKCRVVQGSVDGRKMYIPYLYGEM
jgi:hypothetical protein